MICFSLQYVYLIFNVFMFKMLLLFQNIYLRILITKSFINHSQFKCKNVEFVCYEFFFITTNMSVQHKVFPDWCSNFSMIKCKIKVCFFSFVSEPFNSYCLFVNAAGIHVTVVNIFSIRVALIKGRNVIGLCSMAQILIEI